MLHFHCQLVKTTYSYITKGCQYDVDNYLCVLFLAPSLIGTQFYTSCGNSKTYVPSCWGMPWCMQLSCCMCAQNRHAVSLPVSGLICLFSHLSTSKHKLISLMKMKGTLTSVVNIHLFGDDFFQLITCLPCLSVNSLGSCKISMPTGVFSGIPAHFFCREGRAAFALVCFVLKEES